MWPTDGMVQSGHHSPHQVLHHCVVFVLASTVVSMQGDCSLTQSMTVEVVKHADNCICPLADIINDEVYLMRDSLAADA